MRRLFASFQEDYEDMGLKYAITQKWYDIRHPFRRTYRYLSKLYQYSVYLWDDYDFDDVYIFKILRLKLLRMADFFEKNGMTVSANKHAKEMRIAASLCTRIINNDYMDLPMEQIERKYGKLILDSHPTDNPRLVKLDIHRNPKKGTPEYEAERKESIKVYKHAEWQRQNDINYLFDYMKKHVQGWWD